MFHYLLFYVRLENISSHRMCPASTPFKEGKSLSWRTCCIVGSRSMRSYPKFFYPLRVRWHIRLISNPSIDSCPQLSFLLLSRFSPFSLDRPLLSFSYPKNRLNLVALYDKQEEDLFCLEFVKCIM